MINIFKFFKRKKKEKVVEEIEEEIIEPGPVCGYCEKGFNPIAKSTKISGQKFHRKCYKKLKKDASPFK